jgi:hypothetical protein
MFDDRLPGIRQCDRNRAATRTVRGAIAVFAPSPPLISSDCFQTRKKKGKVCFAGSIYSITLRPTEPYGLPKINSPATAQQ